MRPLFDTMEEWAMLMDFINSEVLCDLSDQRLRQVNKSSIVSVKYFFAHMEGEVFPDFIKSLWKAESSQEVQGLLLVADGLDMNEKNLELESLYTVQPNGTLYVDALRRMPHTCLAFVGCGFALV